MKSKKYLDWLANNKPCLVTGSNYNKDLHHVKCIFRLGQRPPDFFCVPLDHRTHLYELHEMNESEFWEKNGFDILQVVIDFNREYISQHGYDKGYDEMFRVLRKSAGTNLEALEKLDYLTSQIGENYDDT